MNRTEKATLFYIDIVFIAVAIFAAVAGKLPAIPDGGLFAVLLGLASYRGGRALSYNLIFKWIRDALNVREVEDSSGAGMSNESSGSGVRRILGELVCCPICSSTWAAILLLALYAIVPAFGAVFLYALAAAGVAEVLTWVSEYFEWGGRASREISGSFWLEKNGKSPNGNGRKDFLFSRLWERERNERRLQ